MLKSTTTTKTVCYHCGEFCEEETILVDDKQFCCTGCKLVYEILKENNLCTYYSFEGTPGKSKKNEAIGHRYAYLDTESIAEKLIIFKNKNSTHVRFHIPKMHCSSCIWLLEHLSRLDKGVLQNQVNFIQKELFIVFDPKITSLRKLVELLDRIGYEPELNLEQIQQKIKKKKSKIRIYKIGLAGFAFGNIMLLSFPEYFSGGVYNGEDFRKIFGFLNLFLAIPVFFFSANEFMINAWKGIQQKTINIDVPIAIGIIAMFLRSSFEIISGTGAGFFDSMTGLVFFMLLGRNFQDKTYDWLSFDRDYKSYFPISVTRIKNSKSEEPVTVSDLKINDRLRIHHLEIIPADSLLVEDYASIDYSFVTGESNPVNCLKGERIYAGGKLIGSTAEVIVQREVSQSYLTQLWNRSNDKGISISYFQKISAAISKWFVIITLTIATASAIYWYSLDINKSINAFTSVLVIACACALALSAPFTFGNMLRILGKKGIYLKSAFVIERLADVHTIVFDKTGTLTESNNVAITYKGNEIPDEHLDAIESIAACSSHPLSKLLAKHLHSNKKCLKVNYILEHPGKGIEGDIKNHHYSLGSYDFIVGINHEKKDKQKHTSIFIKIDECTIGYFQFNNQYRHGLKSTIEKLQKDNYKTAIITGDHEGEKMILENIFSSTSEIKFNQSPQNKLDYIKHLQKHGDKILMVGDGLNDAGALMQSNIGLTISQDINNFSPACDGIVLNDQFNNLPALLSFAKSGIRIVIISFIISIAYNVIGLYFAIQGTLSPVIAAILMPISTSSLVLYTVIASSLKARKLGLS